MTGPRLGLALVVVATLLAAGCGSSSPAHGEQVLALASDCTKATAGTGADPSATGHYCMTLNSPQAQAPGALNATPAVVDVGTRVLPLCRQLGSALHDASPDGLTTFTSAFVAYTDGGAKVAQCHTGTGPRFLVVTVGHGTTPPTGAGYREKLSDGSTLLQPSGGPSNCVRYYPDGWSVALGAEAQAPRFDEACHTGTAAVHAWLTGS